MKIREIAQRLKISESSVKEKNGKYIVFHTPFCVRGNEMFDENNYLNIECDFELLLEHQVEFKKCKFVKPMILNFKTIEKSITFYDCIFEEDFKIKDSTICEEITILHSRFKKDFYLSTSKCQEDTRLRQCTFYGNVDCHNSIFEKILDLYASEVLGIPNFVGCVNKSKVDLLGFTSQIQFQLLEKYIKTQQQIYKNNYIDDWEYKNFEYLPALEVQDTFRFFKDILLKEGSVLKSSNYHRVELYCKELELDSKPQKTWRDRIDSLQLWFYRLTSDHHTDLAKIFNNVIMLIALFGIFAFGLDSLATHNFSTPKPPQKFIFGMLSKTPNSVAFWSLGLLLGAGILTEIRNIAETYLKGIFLPFLWRSIPSMVLLLILCVLVCESFALLPLWLQETILIFGVCSSFVGIYLFLLWRESRVWIAISYVVSLGILLFKPSLLLPFVGQLFDEGLKANFPAMQSLSVVYCILMFLMLFSLQKTARKNSIIPS